MNVKTQKELAKLAGVSLTTIYNALHRKSLVHEETRQKIYQLMLRHDYQPDGVARSMVRRKTEVLGIIVPSLEIKYYAKLASGIERCANAAGYHCIICQHLDDPSKEHREVSMMRQRRVDGILIRNCGRAGDTDLFVRATAAGVPFVLLGGAVEGFDKFFVGGDDRTDARRMMEYLIGKGHRRIAHLAWYRMDYQMGPRYLGYRDALERNGIEVDPNLVELNQTEYTSGRLEILNILRRTSNDPPTAVFAGNDSTAIGCIRGLREAGLRVPEDVAVVSYGGYVDEHLLPVSLTCLAEPIEEIGRRACEMLIAQIEGKPWKEGPILVPGELRVGQSA